jgi:hypothetical protein
MKDKKNAKECEGEKREPSQQIEDLEPDDDVKGGARGVAVGVGRPGGGG